MVVDSSILFDQFLRRATILGHKHDLAPNGNIDYRAFEEGKKKYPEVLECFNPIIEQTHEILWKTGDCSYEMTKLIEIIRLWCMSPAMTR